MRWNAVKWNETLTMTQWVCLSHYNEMTHHHTVWLWLGQLWVEFVSHSKKFSNKINHNLSWFKL